MVDSPVGFCLKKDFAFVRVPQRTKIWRDMDFGGLEPMIMETEKARI